MQLCQFLKYLKSTCRIFLIVRILNSSNKFVDKWRLSFAFLNCSTADDRKVKQLYSENNYILKNYDSEKDIAS